MGTILTHSEIIMIEKRIAIFLLIERKTSYREIGKLIDVTPNTINFVTHHFVKKPVKHRRYSPFPRKTFPAPIRSSKRIATRMLLGKN